MKLTLHGHDDRYAVEQLQLSLFPDNTEGEAVSSLHRGKVWLTAVTKITVNGVTATATRRIKAADETVRLRRRALQQSYYLAAKQLLPVTPPWGALAGVRPTKITTKHLLEGGTPKSADELLRDVYYVTDDRRRLAIDCSVSTVRAVNMLQPSDLSLYVGIPFCPTRCAYCSFVSASVEKSLKLMEPYLAALTAEVEAAGRMVKEAGLRIKSFYMGGGTPTTLSASQMDALLTAVNRNFDLSDCVEYCIEAGRPDTIDREKLQVLLDHGADRISVNPQSLEPRVLSAIGRKHSPEDIEKAMKGMLTPEFRENVIGHAEVRNVFKITGVGIVAGSYVTDGKLQRNAQVRLLRDNVVVYEGKLSSLQRFKDSVKEVAQNYECGMSIDKFNDIKEGDIFQIVPSQRFEIDNPPDSFDVYRMLRSTNPSPYLYYFKHNDYAVAGASPEMLVSVENRTVVTRPIAGTIKRGATYDEDIRNEQQLLNDPKERAEHTMLVDLGRNDIGKVSEFGSVTVTDMMIVERYSKVMHLVSNVKGTLREDKKPLDALMAVLPAGTLSGAPKVRAMEIIDELETTKRDLYGGTVGYLAFDGSLDTCIAIRTVLFKNNKAYIQAGGGVVADSVPENEYQESCNKAMAVINAIKEASKL